MSYEGLCEAAELMQELLQQMKVLRKQTRDAGKQGAGPAGAAMAAEGAPAANDADDGTPTTTRCHSSSSSSKPDAVPIGSGMAIA